MSRIISASIDLKKIDKSKIVTKDKNGQPFKNGGKFLNIDITVNDEQNDYGQDTSIKVSQSKEEREAKAPVTYLGNGKTVWTDDANKAKAEPGDFQKVNKADLNGDSDDLPF